MFNDNIPQALAQTLRDVGLPVRKQQEECGCKAEGADEFGFRWLYKIPYWKVFDLFLKKGIVISVRPYWFDNIWANYVWDVCNTNEKVTPFGDFAADWNDAANTAIRKAAEIVANMKPTNKNDGNFSTIVF